MRRAVVAGLAALTLVAGCGDDDGDDEAAPVTSTTTVATTSSTATTAAPATTTTVAGPVCPPGDVPAPNGAPATLDAEVDGSPSGDTVLTHLADDGWRLRVDLGDGGAADELLATSPTDVARVVVAVDLDGNGTQELWVQVGTGAAATVVGLFRLDGCDLEPVLLEGTPAEFAIGGTVTLLQGLACGAADVTHLGATSEDGFTYATLDLTYVLQGGELVRVGDESGTLTADDPALAAYSDFGC